jgi:NTE family protein
MGLCEEIFIRSKAMSRLTVPLHSVIDHKRFDEEMRKHYGEHRVEDLPVNFFSVATSLTTNDMHVIREGELWRSVRASSSIPAVFPPVIEDDGEVLIDGALVDNVPINVMRDLKAGPNIVLNFKKGEQWRIHSDYNNLPGRAGAARRILMKRKGDERFPSVVSVLSRTMVITARRLIEATDMGDDVLLEIPTLPRMGFLEWKRGREQFNTAYEAMSRALSETGQCGDMMDRARQAGAKLSA